MTEDEARAQVAALIPEAMPILQRYAERLLAENQRQNLIARSTEATVWSRHLLDSAQLVRFARTTDRTWLDVGSGPGLPGLVIAAAGHWRVTLVEPRRRRAEFLQGTIAALGLAADVIAADVRSVAGRFDLVSARAVAPIAELLGWTKGCTDERTRFLLPKGRSAQSDIDAARRSWHGSFHVEQSLSDPAAGIVIAERVTPR